VRFSEFLCILALGVIDIDIIIGSSPGTNSKVQQYNWQLRSDIWEYVSLPADARYKALCLAWLLFPVHCFLRIATHTLGTELHTIINVERGYQ
jgi:hypothetical protein